MLSNPFHMNYVDRQIQVYMQLYETTQDMNGMHKILHFFILIVKNLTNFISNLHL